MGSDIYTESAIAIKLCDFLNRSEIKNKENRKKIVEIVQKTCPIPEEKVDLLLKSKDSFVEAFVDLIDMSDGYEVEDSKESHDALVMAFCEVVGINFEDLPDYSFRSFESSRESGWEVDADVTYVMFESFGMFETKMTDNGKKLAKALGQEEISETTWTVHSY